MIREAEDVFTLHCVIETLASSAISQLKSHRVRIRLSCIRLEIVRSLNTSVLSEYFINLEITVGDHSESSRVCAHQMQAGHQRQAVTIWLHITNP